MEFTFENQGTSSFLVYPVKENDDIDSLSLGMLTNNRILGLAPTQFVQMNEKKYIKYNISAHVSVDQFFSGIVNKKRLVGVFCGIVNAMLSAEEYMIDSRSIVMDMKYMFADVSSCETELICLPVVPEKTETVDLKPFFKEIMFNTQFDRTEDCDYVASIINYLNSTPNFSLEDFREVLKKLNGNADAAEEPERTPVKKAVVPDRAPEKEPAAPVKPVSAAPPQTAYIPENKPAPAKRAVPVPEPKIASPAKPEKTEKKMSLFYLMQHFSKENMEIYKAQKETEKSSPSEKSPVPDKKKESNKAPAKSRPQPPVPGRPQPPVPGSPRPPQQPPVQVPVQPPQQSPMQVPVQPPQQQNVMSAPPAEVRVSSEGNFGETVVLNRGVSAETTVLIKNNAERRAQPVLIRKKTNEEICINKPVFRIGKERSYVDYFIGDNTAISRSHANIVVKENEYFVVDTNSTNHTYINGRMIMSNTENPIAAGDVLRFANEDFEFRIL